MTADNYIESQSPEVPPDPLFKLTRAYPERVLAIAQGNALWKNKPELIALKGLKHFLDRTRVN
jgi:hypothetical protein